ncbi:hypothetical protein DMN91_012399 [Ooceraea biroi]|uniref:Uncharacterized protein n=1 Tax=Ooceraea biroi TaxID=2015173 RepID=A0A3L8D4M1_OOCBI|nr:uncharacterized protein LOC113563224 [Ooceraea biroi]XP_026830383.1 uncharacterized protein LOC113563224 [Ooceraea biroi]XP_026830384.1 uncharacterized protein LOC113563224 [Ooceraea biroi]XP_026830385.1 uncharacterized protein LOC113563224 [Ooceraea biroi]RLU15405.1 hypothetical protein DMN91_012399 [Ooceraea biroi]
MSTTCYCNLKMIVIVTIMATLYYPALIDTAAIRPEKLSEQEQRNFALLQSQRSMRIRRSIESMEEEKIPKRNCYNSACGWAVYDPVTRNIEYFMKNACTCPDESYKCVRTGDDLSASAYVYRCRQNTTADDIESPEDAN